jgi:hypothetical protein
MHREMGVGYERLVKAFLIRALVFATIALGSATVRQLLMTAVLAAEYKCRNFPDVYSHLANLTRHLPPGMPAPYVLSSYE